MAIYREIQKNTDMAMKALDAISDKIYDDQLAMQAARQSMKYSELHNEATKHLTAAKADGYRGSYFSDMMLNVGIQYNTLLNKFCQQKSISEINFFNKTSAFWHFSLLSLDFLNTRTTDATTIVPSTPAENTLIAPSLYKYKR